MIRRSALMVLVCCLLLGAAWAEEASRSHARLVGVPEAKRTADGFVISFALSAPDDVTVRVLDGNRNVVRHLASGMVGLEKAAKPFAPKSLAQSLPWDGKDDAGRPVDLQGCSASVAVGMTAKFDKFILWENDGFDGCNRIVAGPKDEYYVVQSRGNQEDTVRVFNAEGRRVRTFWPYTLSSPKIREFLHTSLGAEDYDGNRVPVRVTHNERVEDFGPRFTSVVVTTDGYMVGVQGYGGGGGPAIPLLNRASPEGFPTAAGWAIPWHPRRAPSGTSSEKRKLWRALGRAKWNLAPGTDGDFYLADGVHNVVGRFRARDFSPVDFTHSGTKKLEKPRCYIGELDEPGEDESHFKGPDGVTIDKDGRILVLDGDIVKVYEGDGRFVGQKPRGESDYDRVHDPLRDGGLGALAITRAEGRKPGSSGVPAGVIRAAGKASALTFPHFLRTNARGQLCVRNNKQNRAAYLLCDVDGKVLKPWSVPTGARADGGYLCADSQGNWYFSAKPDRRKAAELWKFSPEGKRLKFGEKDAIVVNYRERGGIKGVTVASNGDIYIAMSFNRWEWPKGYKARDGYVMVAGELLQAVRVDVYSPEGVLKREALVKGQGINDVAVDRAGNVYVIETAMFESDLLIASAVGRQVGWAGKLWPPSYLTPEQAALDPKTQSNKRFSLISRLLKYPPSGGTLTVKGNPTHLWQYVGISGAVPVKDLNDPGAQITLDADERLWVPDSFMYCIKAVDTAGNLMATIGRYGNEDCRGGGGDKRLAGTNLIIDPEIPLARPQGMAVWKDYLFIADMYAHRVMRCKLEYSDTKEIAIK